MFGELLESREGVSHNRGTDDDMRDSRELVEWLHSPDGDKAKRRVADALTRIREQRRNRPED